MYSMKKISVPTKRATILLAAILIFVQIGNAQNGFQKAKKEVEKTQKKINPPAAIPPVTVTLPPSTDAYGYYRLFTDKYLSTIKITLSSIKIIGDWDWQLGDDHAMDLYGEININGVNFWKVSNIDCRLSQNNYRDGSYVNLNIDNNLAKQAIDARISGPIDANSTGFSISGKIGDWDLITSAETTFSKFVSIADIRTQHLVNDNVIITVTKNIELDHPAAVELTFSFSEPNPSHH